MGTCSETIYKHRIFFPSIQHLAWLPQGRTQGKQKCGKNSDFWTYALDSRRSVSRGNKNVGCSTWKRRFFWTCGSNNWETVEDRWVHAARQFVCKHRILFPSIQHLAWLPQGRPQVIQKCGLRYVKTAIFFTFVNHVKTNKHMFEFFHNRVATPF